jgi:hypothetical protein
MSDKYIIFDLVKFLNDIGKIDYLIMMKIEKNLLQSKID